MHFFLSHQNIILFDFNQPLDCLSIHLVLPIFMLIAVQVQLSQLLRLHLVLVLGHLALFLLLNRLARLHTHILVLLDEILWR